MSKDLKKSDLIYEFTKNFKKAKIMSNAPTSSNGNSNALTSSNGNINAITSSNSYRTRTTLTLNSRNNIAIHFFEALLLEGIVTAPVESELSPPKINQGY